MTSIDFSDRAHWGVINPRQMGWAGTKYDPRTHPDMLTTITFTSRSGVTFSMRTHKLWAPILLEALRILDPHIQGGFDSEPDKGSYNPKSELQDGSPSMHAVGNAADLEWSENPMYASPRPTGPHTMPADTDKLLRHLGIGWGGMWNDLRDWMHIENHLTPADTSALGRALEARHQEDTMAMTPDIETAFAQLRKLITTDRNEQKTFREQVVRQNGELGRRLSRIEAAVAGDNDQK